jgi:hypothetical protein
MEGMMRRGEDPMKFLPLRKSSQERTEGLVHKWIDSWWRTSEGEPWGNEKLRELSPEDWFSLYDLDSPRLWCPPPAAMEMVMELFNEDRLVNPPPACVAVPRLMTHLWRKALSKDVDVLFSVKAGAPFWPLEMHEPLVIAIVFLICHVKQYRGPWVVRGTKSAVSVEQRLTKGFKLSRKGQRDPQQLYELEGYVQGMWETLEEWSRSLLLEFLNEQGRFPPVQEYLVRKVLQNQTGRSFPHKRSFGGGFGAGDGARKRRRVPDG